MTPPILYDFELSGNCYKVRVFASMINLGLVLQNVEVLKGETRTEEFARLNPWQQIPVLRDGDFVVQDSQAILTYPALKYTPQWIDTTPMGMGAIVEWLSYAAKEVSNGPQLSRLKFLDPHEDIDLVRAQAIGLKVLRLLDNSLASRDWLCLGRPTIADIAVYPYVGLCRQGKLPLDGYPHIHPWLA
ncbi:glutathione S-transferase [Rhizobium leguminosarum bv. trifolii WSM597]|uniref:Glutathione S-transferase n=1 Tax=Rhizobium leguminosarum bv. trifolii WSM597 TaxID=754764 RepID=I9XDE9_RHILT|nr:glutathione S-transferase N-terminal domain-containing protein [Rhizobium leguminosarum]EJB07106.1 glutathione S-transferase [Rhizobium leguminosarum bv. trifolii WSM597]